ncbi:MAG: tRNA (adenosine(37)-N6)-threonylcarbamoyltransferase complex transferase subunit TsaD [Candidatus Levybacteria bacterium]|nr:tRNA (adenosine(37)-N6)-threonylcarbamoyltransferase complex transferase subunit TsaD [Candidatus Levybacteria bacterium]
MTILGIETSCDETAAAIIVGKDSHVDLRANIVASSLAMHIPTGGIIPENAAREQLKFILPVINQALADAGMTLEDIDAIAVTFGPGLIGSLLVGVETAKTIAYVLNKPLIPVNHMVGHIYANFINVHHKSETKLDAIRYTLDAHIAFPLLALVVSGGHTDLLLMKEHGHFQLLGGTRDDAAGEALDKIGRLIGVAYPAGPVIEQMAKSGDPNRFRFPRPLVGSPDFDYSFSGLKTAVLREVKNLGNLDAQTKKDIARGTLDAIIDVLIKKTVKAAAVHEVKSIILSGGVAANQTLRTAFEDEIAKRRMHVTFHVPPRHLCTDNAAMIASAAYFNPLEIEFNSVTANPELYFD